MKTCLSCTTTFISTGRNHKYCVSCAKQRQREAIKSWAIKNGRLNGKGSGSSTSPGELNPNYIHGRCTFRRKAQEKRLLNGVCERCKKDLTSASQWEWAGHHKDHNQNNNSDNNLELLCKRCHQLEHNCVNAFEGVTTIRDNKTGRFKRIEAPSPTEVGDDMVCSIQ